MSQSSLKLTDAIEGNRSGLHSLVAYRTGVHAEIERLRDKERTLDDEIAARRNLQVAMENLQSVFPDDETIKFVVPSGDS